MKVKEIYWNRIYRNILELNFDYPEYISDFPSVVKDSMEKAAAQFCKSIEIPAEVSVGKHWIH